jgi:hypothetical protein
MHAAREAGFVREEDWPFEPYEIDDKPPPVLAVKAYSQKGFTWSRVWEQGQDRGDAIEEGMRKRCTCLFGMRVDEPFKNHLGSEPIREVDPLATAGHGMSVLAVERRNGERVFRVDNWWQEWGMEDGTGYLAESVIAHPLVTLDVFMIEATPVFA